MGTVHVQSTAETLRVVVEGVLTTSIALDIITTHYPRLNGRGCLWDFRQCALDQLSAADLELIAQTVAEAAPATATPKSAFLVADAKAYARVCSYLSRGTRIRAPIEAAVFKSEPEALRWLKGR